MAKLSAEELKKLPVYEGTSMATAGKDTLLYIDKATTTGKSRHGYSSEDRETPP